MFSKSKHKIGIYLIFSLIMIVILGFWFYSLKINLENGFNKKHNKPGFTLTELKQNISEIISKSPLSKKSEKKNSSEDEQLNKLAGELAEKIKNNKIQK